MNKCLKINISIEIQEGLLQNFIQKNAKKFNIEGNVQIVGDQVKIIACGKNTDMDDFLDSLYVGYKNTKPTSIDAEPFLKDRDYRGVFRVIE